MKRFLIALAMLTFSVAAHGQGADCPDYTTQLREAQITYGPTVECGGTFKFEYRGVQVGKGDSICPTFVVIRPPFQESVHRPGCGTYTVPSTRHEVITLFFRCVKTYFIIIPIGSECELKDTRVTAHIQSYQAVPCRTIKT